MCVLLWNVTTYVECVVDFQPIFTFFTEQPERYVCLWRLTFSLIQAMFKLYATGLILRAGRHTSAWAVSWDMQVFKCYWCKLTPYGTYCISYSIHSEAPKAFHREFLIFTHLQTDIDEWKVGYASRHSGHWGRCRGSVNCSRPLMTVFICVTNCSQRMKSSGYPRHTHGMFIRPVVPEKSTISGTVEKTAAEEHLDAVVL